MFLDRISERGQDSLLDRLVPSSWDSSRCDRHRNSFRWSGICHKLALRGYNVTDKQAAYCMYTLAIACLPEFGASSGVHT